MEGNGGERASISAVLISCTGMTPSCDRLAASPFSFFGSPAAAATKGGRGKEGSPRGTIPGG